MWIPVLTVILSSTQTCVHQLSHVSANTQQMDVSGSDTYKSAQMD